jgi:nucleotide-binding universal stress UspA family protein
MGGCYRNILVPVDGSRAALAAVSQAVFLARDQNARLTLLTVEAPDAGVAIGMQPPGRGDAFERALREASRSIPGDVGVTTMLVKGEPGPTILRVAAHGGYDLVVMGSHGHGRMYRALLGSVSERVLRDAEIPVLLVPQAAKTPTAAGEPNQEEPQARVGRWQTSPA